MYIFCFSFWYMHTFNWNAFNIVLGSQFWLLFLLIFLFAWQVSGYSFISDLYFSLVRDWCTFTLCGFKEWVALSGVKELQVNTGDPTMLLMIMMDIHVHHRMRHCAHLKLLVVVFVPLFLRMIYLAIVCCICRGSHSSSSGSRKTAWAAPAALQQLCSAVNLHKHVSSFKEQVFNDTVFFLVGLLCKWCVP